MSLYQVLVILWRRGWIVVLTFLSAVVAASGVLLLVPGRYDAVATASIDPAGGGSDQLMGSATGAAAIGLMQGNLVQLVQSQRVAVDVVKRLNLTGNPRTQQAYRDSDSFGRESIDEWMAVGLLKNLDAKFVNFTNVLSIKYKAADPNQAALVANAFLAATIDASIGMKAASADQTARWFAPQIESLRKELDEARSALEAFQARTNVVAPTTGADSETSTLMSITAELTNAKAGLSSLQSRLTSDATDLSTDPSDPDLQLLASLKEKLSSAETNLEAAKNSLGANNPKMVSEGANIVAIRKQITDATNKMHQHLKDRIQLLESQVASLEAAKEEAQKSLIAVQAQRNRLGELERDVGFRIEELNAQEKTAAQARLQSKLTFADISILDKAAPPIAPAFPKPIVVIPVGAGAGLALGLVLALLAEMTDRRIRLPVDLEFATNAPLLGVINASKISRLRSLSSRRRLRAA